LALLHYCEQRITTIASFLITIAHLSTHTRAPAHERTNRVNDRKQELPLLEPFTHSQQITAMLLRIGARAGGEGGERRVAAAAAAVLAVERATSAPCTRSAASSASASASTTTAPPQPDHRARVLSLFRAILREARGMPTENRRTYIEKRAKVEFREGAVAGAASSEEAAFLVALAETQLENAMVQRRLLSELKRKGQLKS
jgi:hypothetical protein